jgi:hypothetical protein
MRSAALSLAVFLIPFGLYGNFVGRSVAKHLAQAEYLSADITLGYWSFFLFAGLMAGLACLAIKKILTFDSRIRYFALGVVLLPLLWGYFLADATLGEYYDRPGMCGGVLDWLSGTVTAFGQWGFLPAVVFFCLAFWRNRTIEPLHESS